MTEKHIYKVHRSLWALTAHWSSFNEAQKTIGYPAWEFRSKQMQEHGLEKQPCGGKTFLAPLHRQSQGCGSGCRRFIEEWEATTFPFQLSPSVVALRFEYEAAVW